MEKARYILRSREFNYCKVTYHWNLIGALLRIFVMRIKGFTEFSIEAFYPLGIKEK